jgi:Sulfotransferase family
VNRGTGGFDAESLLEEAVEIAESSDFGDPPVRPALDVLLRSLDKEAELDSQGKRRTRRLLVAQLTKRLRIQQEVLLHPKIKKIEIEKPLIVLGLPRTGTTLFQNLLALDPSHRAPRTWELLFPVAIQRDASQADLLKIAEDWVRDMNRSSPRLQMIHPIVADWPGECYLALQTTLIHRVFETRNNIPSYSKWLDEQDMRPSYRHYRLQLQCMLKRVPAERLLLKDPLHLWYLPELFDVFPDACVVFLHRDPVESLPSFSSLCSALTELTSPNVDARVIGAEVVRRAAEGLERMMRARASIDPARIFDVQYQDVMRDPAGAVHRAYEYFGYRCSSETSQKIKEWLVAHPQHHRGVHRYGLAQFGLNPTQVKQQFAEYRERFVTTKR